MCKSSCWCSNMSKATLIAVCLLGASAVVVLRAAGHEPAGKLATMAPLGRASPPSAGETNDAAVVNSASKADKLPVLRSADATKAVVSIEPQVAAPVIEKRPEPAPTETKSWHWNARSNKITRK